MQTTFQFPKTDHNFYQKLIQRINTAGNPTKVVLFGSRARGDHQPDSDLDILIVEESDVPRMKRSRRYRKALKGFFPAKDIVVWTPDEVEEWQNVPNAFITTILNEGQVLYERPV